jgi:protein-S-isoprenylcysteine O-methyltransferase Ste14
VKSLVAKTLIGFTQLLICLAVLLFAPAWTLKFWQAWVYLLLFFGASGLITTYLWKKDQDLLKRRVNAGPGAEMGKSQRMIQSLASLAFISLMVLPSLDHRFSWSHLPLAFEIVGDVLVALGFLAVFLVFKENSFAAGIISVASDQTVVSTGPYAIIRHPMYSGALVMIFGTPLALGSWWGLLMFAAMTFVIILRLLDEEKFLCKRLPGYPEYCQKVRWRLLPFVW